MEKIEAAMEGLEKKITGKVFGSPGPCQIHEKEKVSREVSFGDSKIVHWICEACEAEEASVKKKEAIKAKNEAAQEAINRKLQNAMVNPRFLDKTLSNWRVESPEQREVMVMVERFLKDYRKCNGLIFSGRPGTGKNHLACAIAKHFVFELNKTALVTTAFKIVRAIKSSWATQTEEKVIKSFVDVDLLVIDEIGVQFGSETEILYLTEIINDRYEFERPTILISNKTAEEIHVYLGERIIDRFKEGGHVLVFDWDSYRGKKP